MHNVKIACYNRKTKELDQAKANYGHLERSAMESSVFGSVVDMHWIHSFLISLPSTLLKVLRSYSLFPLVLLKASNFHCTPFRKCSWKCFAFTFKQPNLLHDQHVPEQDDRMFDHLHCDELKSISCQRKGICNGTKKIECKIGFERQPCNVYNEKWV